MSNKISNFQIEEAFKNIVDEDISNNFVGVFPSNYMNKFIDHKIMISGKKGKVPVPYSKYRQLHQRGNSLVEYTRH